MKAIEASVEMLQEEFDVNATNHNISEILSVDMRDLIAKQVVNLEK